MIGKVLTLGTLYFVQGIPYGFQDKFIPMYLRVTGYSYTKLSLTKLLLLPWLCKAGFSPLIDLVWTKWIWLLLSICLLTTVSFMGMFLSSNYFLAMSLWLLFLNLFSAFQDVSVDAIAMHLLKEGEMGHGNSAQVVGYKLGALFGGGILIWVHSYYGWSFLCLSLASLYLFSTLAILPLYKYNSLIEERRKSCAIDTVENKDTQLLTNPSKETHSNLVLRRTSSSAANIVNPKEELSSKQYGIFEIPYIIFNTQGTIPALLFLLLYKLGEKGALSIFPIFLIDQGIPARQVSIWSGVLGQISSLFGSLYAGWLLSRKWKLNLLLFYVIVARSIPIFIQMAIIDLWYSEAPQIFHTILFYVGAASLCALEFTAGLVTTSVATLMMSCSLKAPPSVQATYYSVLSSVEVAGKLLFASAIGALVDIFGLSKVFSVLSALSLVVVFIIPYVK